MAELLTDIAHLVDQRKAANGSGPTTTGRRTIRRALPGQWAVNCCTWGTVRGVVSDVAVVRGAGRVVAVVAHKPGRDIRLEAQT
jgi:hypothetical protein